jgi:hypothetical protein
LRNYQRPDGTASEEFRRVYAEKLAFEETLDRERAVIDRQGGGIMNLLDRERSARRAALDAAPWVTSPQVVSIGHEAQLALPVGYRYLSPEAVSQFAQRELLVPEGVEGLAVIEAIDGGWRAHIRVLDTGAVNFSDPLPSSEDLLILLRARRVGLFADKPAPNMGAMIMMRWLIEPVVDVPRRRMVFALNSTDLQTNSNSQILQVTRFGYSQTILVMVDFAGVLRINDFEYYQDDVVQLVDAIQVSAPVERPALDPRTQSRRLFAKDFVTGVPTDKETAFLKRLDDETNPFSRDNIMEALGKALGPLALLLSMLALRARKRAK